MESRKGDQAGHMLVKNAANENVTLRNSTNITRGNISQ